MGQHTFLGKPPSPMGLEFFRVVLSSDYGIAPCLCKVKEHRFFEKFEALYLFDCALGGFDFVEHNEGLSFGLEVGLRNEIDDIAVLREDLRQCFLELIDLDSLF